jgi:uncharacterized membrane protein
MATTPASIKDHPIHLMLIPIPIGLWVFALVADLVGGGSGEWRTVAYYCLGGGIAGALLAALPGLVDLVSLSDPAAKRVALLHMAINLAAVAIFAFNFYLRMGSPGHAGPLWLTVVGVLAISVSGWLGGELVHRHGIGVANR